MEFTKIPNIEQKVSRVGLGTWSIGGSLWGGTDKEASIATLLEAFKQGINFIDTAPAYGKGESERIVGEALQRHGKREEIVLATKFGLNQESENVFRDSRKHSIVKELDQSLINLKVDYIDLYQVHWPDHATSFAETAEALLKLLEQGKIRAIGVSNFSVKEIETFRKTAPIHAVQPPLNLFEQAIESDLLPYCLREGIALVSYSALCRGMLSGKMSRERQFKGDDLRGGMDPKFKEPLFSDYVNAANALKAWVEKKYARSLPALAVRWVLDKGVNIALWGARKPEQLVDVSAIEGWKLSEADLKEIQKLIAEHVHNPVGPEFMSPPERG